MHIISGVFWDKGQRTNNQDSLVLEQVMTAKGRIVLAAVCDGIGGLDEGEIASGYACEKLKTSFYEEIIPLLIKNKGRKKIKKCFYRCIYSCSELFSKYAKERHAGLGTTVSVLLLWKRQYLLAHLGDSRIYRLKGKRISRLTNDHQRENNVLTKCLGSFGYQMPDIKCGRVRRKEGFLICSDGFYHLVDEKLLVSVLNTKEIADKLTIDKRLKQLSVYSQKNGETDNMTAIFLLCKKESSKGRLCKKE